MRLVTIGSARDDTGSLMLALLVGVVGMSMTALIAPMVVAQIKATGAGARRVHAVAAAQAGLDAALAQVRAADDGAGNGVRASLPCGPFSGSVGGGVTGSYQVTIHYVNTDPLDAMADAPDSLAGDVIGCLDAAGPNVLPAYAVFVSTGTDSTTSRVLRGAYRFRTSNKPIPGGHIHLYRSSGIDPELCLDAGEVASPTVLVLAACSSGGSRQAQLFAYTQDLTLQLVKSVTPTRELGLCVDVGAAVPPAAGPVGFQPCQSPAPARQRWTYSGPGWFMSAVSATNDDGYVLQAPGPGSAGTVSVASVQVADGQFNNHNTLLPDAKVGPGSAGPKNGQVVNFNQFGKCLDLTGLNHMVGYMISWPCKAGAGTWNQTYSLPPVATGSSEATPGWITMTAPVGASQNTPAGRYCLKSPGTTAFGQYPTMVPCPAAGSDDTGLKWKVYGFTGIFASSYRIQDEAGNCLQAADQKLLPSDFVTYGTQQISRIQVRSCTESTLQKWNADPDILEGIPLKYVGEN